MNIKAKALQILENTAKKIPAVNRLLEKEYDKLSAKQKKMFTALRDDIFALQTEMLKTKTDFDYKYYLKEMRNAAVKMNNEANKEKQCLRILNNYSKR